jgi:hypothetical protein
MKFRTLALAVMLAGLSSTSIAETNLATTTPVQSTVDSTTPVDFWSQILNARDGAVVYSAACCKVCRKGKACGDSCISRSYTCRKGVGCACDG